MSAPEDENESGPDFSFLGNESEETEAAFNFDVNDVSSPDVESAGSAIPEIDVPSAADSAADDVPSFDFEGVADPEPNFESPVTDSPDSEVAEAQQEVEAAAPQSSESSPDVETPPAKVEEPPKKKVRKLKRRSAEPSPPEPNVTTAVDDPVAESSVVKTEPDVSETTDDVDSGSETTEATNSAEENELETPDAKPESRSNLAFVMVAGYAAALTIVVIVLIATGRLSMTGAHPLESLPDIEPLKPSEFQMVPDEASLPPMHDLKLGESRRFGNVEVTAVRVSREQISTVLRSKPNAKPEQETTSPVMKLWFRVKNMSDDTTFAPWDIGLMCHRNPEFSVEESTLANSWLRADYKGEDVRILNYLHPPESPFMLVGQYSGKQLSPGEDVETFIACSEDIRNYSVDSIASFRWRLQIRKGVGPSGKFGVTTLIDVHFHPDEIAG